ncbi:acyl carrier protein [Streptomyces hainanensis]|uniref:acyl carrier protein n=1 Tax=Streptomyces hainanensis TaxID=402648 RepID=UPI001404D322|nr:phosphopantetheine-binding protein [Streptomyces hainanensis]
MTQDAAQGVSQLHTAVRSIVAEELEIEPEELTENANFEEEYEADSLSLLAIVARFEHELSVVIPSDRVGEMVNLDMVLKLVSENSGAGSDV